jgi:hypothetical protein
MRNILTFLNAVRIHWGSLVTGGSIIGVIGTYQGTGHPVAPWIYWSIAVIALIVAFYNAWLDQYRKVKELEATASAHAIVPQPATRVDVHISRESEQPTSAPRFGVRVENFSGRPSRGAMRVSVDAKFHVRHIGGPAATSITFDPIYSAKGLHSLRLEPLSYLAKDEDRAVNFEVWENGQRPFQKIIDSLGWPDILATFLFEGYGSDPLYPLVIRFFDPSGNFRSQIFQMEFSYDTYKFTVTEQLQLKELDGDKIT